MKIPLTQGKYAIVDDEDYERVSQKIWHYFNGGYAACKPYHGKISEGKYKRTTIYMHRFIMNTPDGMDTDHLNGDKLDNRKCNLRICTKSQNRRNQKKTHGFSKYKGVRWHSIGKKWQAGITVNNKPVYLGLFGTEDEAGTAYNMAALRYFREYAKLNLIGVSCGN